jgi:transcriptional regulator with XRE-family HTH domain
MNDKEAGRALRAIRHRQAKRLSDVAMDTGLSRATASRVERGEWERLAFGNVTAVASALGARLSMEVSWRGAELDRVLDEGHARLVGIVVRRLAAVGWETRVEVSYSVFGERGSIDVFGWHQASASLAVVEVKSEMGSVEGLLRPLDAKVRLAPTIARDQFGWRAARVARIVVFPESDAVRRTVARHAVVFDAALPARSLAVRAWLRAPAGSLRGRWFVSDSHRAAHKRNPSSVRRIRVPHVPRVERA